jgi:DNA-binding NtrC family response regulator
VTVARRDQMKHGKVLVVDDEPAERDGLARLVGQWGYEVETAGSGEEALTLVESQHPAVVVTDLVLPEMDGLTLLEKLKETGRPPIVLLVTGQGTVETAVEAMRRGALDYITKPFKRQRVIESLRRALEGSEAERETGADSVEDHVVGRGLEGHMTLREVADLYIERILRLAQGNKVKAARTLGINRRTLYRRAKATREY